MFEVYTILNNTDSKSLFLNLKKLTKSVNRYFTLKIQKGIQNNIIYIQSIIFKSETILKLIKKAKKMSKQRNQKIYIYIN